MIKKNICLKHGVEKKHNGKKLICSQCKSEKVIDIRIRKKILLINLFGGKCSKCGYNKCISALTFHHLDPKQKSFNISGTQKSFKTLKQEAEKCILLCRNCHAEEHAPISHFNFKDKIIKIQTQTKVIKKCLICNNKCKSNNSKFCSKKCYMTNITSLKNNKQNITKKSQQQISKLKKESTKQSKSELIQKTQSLILQNRNYTETGKILGVSSNAIKKRVKKYLPEIYQQINQEKDKNILYKKCQYCKKQFKTRIKLKAYCNQICHIKMVKQQYNKHIKTIIELKLKKFSHKEIAENLGLQRRTVCWYIHKYNKTK